MESMESVFKNIRAECARNSLTIDEFSKLLHIQRKTFYNWEGKKDFPAKYLTQMATILNVTPDELLGFKTDNK